MRCATPAATPARRSSWRSPSPTPSSGSRWSTAAPASIRRPRPPARPVRAAGAGCSSSTSSRAVGESVPTPRRASGSRSIAPGPDGGWAGNTPMGANERSGRFEARIAVDEEVVSVILSGEADMANRRAVDRALRQAADRSPEVVILDLRALTFLDASGLDTILGADERSRVEGWTLIVLGGPPSVQLAFEATRTEALLHLIPDRSATVTVRGR